MIQFDLLPDVKQEYIKTERFKRLVLGAALLTTGAAIFILLVLISIVYVVQKKQISDLNHDIKTSSDTLQNTPNLAEILTVQSQLNSLSSLHQQKPVASRIFGYLAQLTPTQVTISTLNVDFSLHTIAFQGNAPDLASVNTFVDELKYTTYSQQGSSTSTPAFSRVILSSFSRSSASATYSISLSYDTTIFNSASNVTLSVGGQSQSAVTQPSIIFKKDQ